MSLLPSGIFSFVKVDWAWSQRTHHGIVDLREAWVITKGVQGHVGASRLAADLDIREK